ncbi:GH39 family glycosyl hydrolase [Epilithonimonas hominis]|uniref:GH39 family glycosyl hydrolase n=1 Tax=Epilithonimonas hominis TaxID=420404 RepID=UPI0028A0F214|nr:hypothetical protein [Epilithonimonas hominis]
MKSLACLFLITISFLVYKSFVHDNKISVDFSIKPQKKESKIGFLHSDNLKILENNILILKPKLWRLGNTITQKPKRIEQLNVLKKNNITPIIVINDLYSTLDHDWQRPYLKSNKLLVDMISDLYLELGNNVIYDIWNEPNMSWIGSEEQFFDTFKRVHNKIRSMPGGDKAIITGPSITGYHKDYLDRFLQYCEKNNIRIDILNWHENGVQNDAAIMKDNINNAKNILIKKYPKVGIKDVAIYEFIRESDYFKPLTSLAYINFLDLTSTAGCKTCGDAPKGQETENTCWNNSIDGLLTAQGKPRSVWWVYKYYAESLNTRFSTSVDSENTVAITYYSQPNNSVNILLGNLSSSSSTFTIDLKTIQKFSLFSKSKKINYSLYKIPNTEQKELLNPILIKKGNISVTNKNTASLSLDDIDTQSVYLLKMNN